MSTYRDVSDPSRPDHGEASETETVDAYDSLEMDEHEDDLDRGDDDDDAPADDQVSDDDVDSSALEEMRRFETTFEKMPQQYRLIKRIGEGTFSTVYKAEVVDHRTGPRFVAIKKIYVTSSPMRIYNELELLNDLRSSPNVCPLLTAFRHHDQVIAILPYYRHQDFRDYFRDFDIDDMSRYFRCLFIAVKAVHDQHIVHRDIKPTNFLYSPDRRKGVLVDFGLAERETTDWHVCHCKLPSDVRRQRLANSVYASIRNQYRENGQPMPAPAFPKEDQRSSRRANRAGTRGFRAPEVLLKCTMQSCIIDVWSCGVILLTFLTRRFPFFHSADDIDAFIELSTIFGRKRMEMISLLHGQALHTNIPSITETGHAWEKIILWSTGRNKHEEPLDENELQAVDFLRGCLELDPAKRLTPKAALAHPFIQRTADDV